MCLWKGRWFPSNVYAFWVCIWPSFIEMKHLYRSERHPCQRFCHILAIYAGISLLHPYHDRHRFLDWELMLIASRILSQIQPFVDAFAHSEYSDQYCGFVLAFLWQFSPLCMEKWNELNYVSYLVHNRMVELCAGWLVDYCTCAFVCHNVSIRIFVCWVRFALCVNLK